MDVDLVVGATGQVGGLIARLLLERGEPVRALVRGKARAADLAAAGADLVVGDLKDPDSLRPALEGVECVLTTANSAGARSPDDTARSVDRDGNRHLIEAAEAAGTQRFVFVSVLGASPDSPVEFLAAKGATEERLRSSSLTETILQPDAFMDFWPAGIVGAAMAQGRPVTLLGEPTHRHSWIAARDVAAWAVATVHHPDAAGLTLPVGGPEALTWTEVIDVYERVLGRQADVEILPPDAVPPGMDEFTAGFLRALETYDSVLDMTEAARRFDVTPTRLADFVASHPPH